MDRRVIGILKPYLQHRFGWSEIGFGSVRFLLGIGEGGNLPASIEAVGEWLPRRDRALVTGLFNSGSNIGDRKLRDPVRHRRERPASPAPDPVPHAETTRLVKEAV